MRACAHLTQLQRVAIAENSTRPRRAVTPIGLDAQGGGVGTLGEVLEAHQRGGRSITEGPNARDGRDDAVEGTGDGVAHAFGSKRAKPFGGDEIGWATDRRVDIHLAK